MISSRLSINNTRPTCSSWASMFEGLLGWVWGLWGVGEGDGVGGVNPTALFLYALRFLKAKVPKPSNTIVAGSGIVAVQASTAPEGFLP